MWKQSNQCREKSDVETGTLICDMLIYYLQISSEFHRVISSNIKFYADKNISTWCARSSWIACIISCCNDSSMFMIPSIYCCFASQFTAHPNISWISRPASRIHKKYISLMKSTQKNTMIKRVINNSQRSRNRHTHLLAIPFRCSGNIGLYEITIKMNTQDFWIVFFYRIGNLF